MKVCISFQVPEDEKPLEVYHSSLSALIKLDKDPSTRKFPTLEVEKERADSSKTVGVGTYIVRYETYVYREPREDSDKIARLERGMEVYVVGVQGEWLEIRSKHGRPPGFVREGSAAPSPRR